MSRISNVFGRPIVVYPAFVKIMGSPQAAIMLGQALYWSARLPPDREGWFYKSHEEWEEETGLTRKQQSTARKHLVEAGFLEEERRGIDPTLWYRVNEDHLANTVLGMGETDQPYVPNGTSDRAKLPTVNNTESTSESTTDLRLTPYTLFEAMCSVIHVEPGTLTGRDLNRQLAPAKRLIDAGTSLDEVKAITSWLQGQTWIVSGIDMFLIEKMRSKWILAGRPTEAKSPQPINIQTNDAEADWFGDYYREGRVDE